MSEKGKTYRYSVGVTLRDSDHRILAQKYYFFNSMKDVSYFCAICDLLKWEVFTIDQEVNL